MLSPSPAESGAITAEMMIGLPVLTAVMGVALLGLQAGVVQYRLEDQVAVQARFASLGADVPGATTTEGLMCVQDEVILSSGIWALQPLVLSASACALNPGGEVGEE